MKSLFWKILFWRIKTYNNHRHKSNEANTLEIDNVLLRWRCIWNTLKYPFQICMKQIEALVHRIQFWIFLSSQFKYGYNYLAGLLRFWRKFDIYVPDFCFYVPHSEHHHFILPHKIFNLPLVMVWMYEKLPEITWILILMPVHMASYKTKPYL